MSLAHTFDTMHALLTGATSHEDAARALYGEVGVSSVDAARLHIYRNAYLHNVRDCSATLFPVTRRIVLRVASEQVWKDLQNALAKEHPMPEIRFGTAALVDVLAGSRAGELGLPPWIGELADLELWERRIAFAPDAAPQSGLRLAEPHVLREYRHDVLSVRYAADPALVVPRARMQLAGIWRIAGGVRRTRPLSALDLSIARAVHREAAIDPAAIVDALQGRVTEAQVLAARDRLLDLELLRA